MLFLLKFHKNNYFNLLWNNLVVKHMSRFNIVWLNHNRPYLMYHKYNLIQFHQNRLTCKLQKMHLDLHNKLLKCRLILLNYHRNSLIKTLNCNFELKQHMSCFSIVWLNHNKLYLKNHKYNQTMFHQSRLTYKLQKMHLDQHNMLLKCRLILQNYHRNSQLGMQMSNLKVHYHHMYCQSIDLEMHNKLDLKFRRSSQQISIDYNYLRILQSMQLDLNIYYLHYMTSGLQFHRRNWFNLLRCNQLQQNYMQEESYKDRNIQHNMQMFHKDKLQSLNSHMKINILQQMHQDLYNMYLQRKLLELKFHNYNLLEMLQCSCLHMHYSDIFKLNYNMFLLLFHNNNQITLIKSKLLYKFQKMHLDFHNMWMNKVVSQLHKYNLIILLLNKSESTHRKNILNLNHNTFRLMIHKCSCLQLHHYMQQHNFQRKLRYLHSSRCLNIQPLQKFHIYINFKNLSCMDPHRLLKAMSFRLELSRYLVSV
ncbi:unnamed protein product [Paramecium octaurelia]|uniref:Uncharacterized protein n=1 Tax=Paramecium octaurelia TaxID=43137 RepID=A0A8S1THS2_PAROT|nr:unnamed protein product [Paramecium octaurelia]